LHVAKSRKITANRELSSFQSTGRGISLPQRKRLAPGQFPHQAS
jgi:hypothetical protein